MTPNKERTRQLRVSVPPDPNSSSQPFAKRNFEDNHGVFHLVATEAIHRGAGPVIEQLEPEQRHHTRGLRISNIRILKFPIRASETNVRGLFCRTRNSLTQARRIRSSLITLSEIPVTIELQFLSLK